MILMKHERERLYRQAISPYDIPGLHSAYDAILDTQPAGAITTIQDRQSTFNLTGTATLVKSPETFYKFVAANSEFVAASTAADWKFLSNSQGGYTTISKVRFKGTQGVIYDTVGGSTLNHGICLYYTANKIWYRLGNGVSGTFLKDVIYDYPFNNTDEWAIVSVRYVLLDKDKYTGSSIGTLTISINGLVLVTDTITSTTASTPTFPFRIGRLGTGAFYSDLEVEAHFSYNHVIGFDELKRATEWLAARNSKNNIIHEVSTDSMYNAFPSVAKSPTSGLITACWSRRLGHVVSDSLIVKSESIDGKVWNNPTKLLEEIGFDMLEFSVRHLRDGTTVYSGRRVNIGSSAGQQFVLINGVKKVIPNPYNDWYVCGQPIVQLPSYSENEFIVPLYGRNVENTPGDAWGVKLMHTSDRGDNWTVKGTIVDPQADTSKSFSECCVIHNPTTGNLIAFIREGKGNAQGLALYRSVSTDGGVTWSAPSLWTSKLTNVPKGFIAASGKLFIFGRCKDSRSINSRGAIGYSSNAASDYSTFSGFYFIDALDGFSIGIDGLELSAGKFLLAYSSEQGAQSGVLTRARAMYRSIILDEATIVANALT